MESRFGQQKDVYIFNLVAEDTREGQIVAKIFDKLEEIRNALGNEENIKRLKLRLERVWQQDTLITQQ